MMTGNTGVAGEGDKRDDGGVGGVSDGDIGTREEQTAQAAGSAPSVELPDIVTAKSRGSDDDASPVGGMPDDMLDTVGEVMDRRYRHKGVRFSERPVPVARVTGLLSDVSWTAVGEDSGHRVLVRRSVSPVWWRRIILVWVFAAVFFAGGVVFADMPLLTAVVMTVISLLVIVVVTGAQRVLTDEEAKVDDVTVIDRPLLDGLRDSAGALVSKIRRNGIPGAVRDIFFRDDDEVTYSPDQAISEIDALFSATAVARYQDDLVAWYGKSRDNLRVAAARGWGVTDCGCAACDAVSNDGGISFREPGVVVHRRLQLAGDPLPVASQGKWGRGLTASVTEKASSAGEVVISGINDPGRSVREFRRHRALRRRSAGQSSTVASTGDDTGKDGSDE